MAEIRWLTQLAFVSASDALSTIQVSLAMGDLRAPQFLFQLQHLIVPHDFELLVAH